ncbi:hypothetical protein [Bacillus toyonensis]|uniref:hypothetical protein n=1 Tax=Bacillus toyonensis TaxID=155322 RepID=UPI000BF822B4|nr:hypothetical protein [Bacillus toyonensis]PGF04983.1 hypothetical protein COM61_00655 [Bacillus toyonensis]
MNEVEVRIPNGEEYITFGYIDIDEESGRLTPNVPFRRTIGQNLQVRLVAFNEVWNRDFMLLVRVYDERKEETKRYFFSTETLVSWDVDHVLLLECQGDEEAYLKLVENKL